RERCVRVGAVLRGAHRRGHRRRTGDAPDAGSRPNAGVFHFPSARGRSIPLGRSDRRDHVSAPDLEPTQPPPPSRARPGAFPLGQVPAGVLTFWFDNIPDPNYSFMLGDDQGNFFARVYAVDADNPTGIRSLPSNVITYSVFYTNPIGPPPVLTAPPNGATLT